MPDPFSLHNSGLDSPAEGAAAVTPNDGADLDTTSRALWVGVAGNLSVIMAGGQTVTFSNVPVGWHPIRARRVRATSTTASSIVAVW